MALNSEPNEVSRKTLDEIRREIDAEYQFVVPPAAARDVGDAQDHRRRAPAPAERPTVHTWAERDDEDARRFEEMSARQRFAMGRFAARAEERRPRRSGYVLAALVGCLAGQAVLLAFLTIARPSGSLDVSGTSVAIAPGAEADAPAPGPTAGEPLPATETDRNDDAPAAAPARQSSRTTASPTSPSESRPTAELPARTVQEPSASAPQSPASVSTATVPGSRTSDGVPSRGTSAARRPIIAPTDAADAQARLRSALNDWLRASARGGPPLQTTEPVIVLGPDGRTAKTYVSVTSPVGLVPREQRWELGPRGWSLVDDRQAGLPRPAPASRSR